MRAPPIKPINIPIKKKSPYKVQENSWSFIAQNKTVHEQKTWTRKPKNIVFKLQTSNNRRPKNKKLNTYRKQHFIHSPRQLQAFTCDCFGCRDKFRTIRKRICSSPSPASLWLQPETSCDSASFRVTNSFGFILFLSIDLRVRWIIRE